MAELDEQFRTDVVLYNMQAKKVFTDKERFIFLQLPRFTKEAEDCKNDFERWIYVLKNMEVLDRMPWVAKDSVFHRLAQIAEVSNMSEEDRIKYDSALRHYRDTISVLQGAIDKGKALGQTEGFAKGQAEGRAEGRAEGVSNVAKKMKENGISSDIITKMTGLSTEEIEKL